MMKKIAFITAVFAAVVLPSVRLETATTHLSTFQFTGDGRFNMIDVITGERIILVYRDGKGTYDDSALGAVSHTLRCHGKSEFYDMSLKLIELVDHLQDHFGQDEVEVISGYRSPEYNESLRRRLRRVAHDSLHMQGLAMDVRFPKINKHALATYARSLGTGGVGVYGDSTFVHLDVGPVRNW